MTRMEWFRTDSDLPKVNTQRYELTKLNGAEFGILKTQH